MLKTKSTPTEGTNIPSILKLMAENHDGKWIQAVSTINRKILPEYKNKN